MFNGSTIKSKDNARLKFARRVRDGKEARFMFIEGARLCDEALSSNIAIASCFVSEGLLESRSANILKSKMISSEVESFVVPDALLKSISDTKTPQGIVLIARRARRMDPVEGLSHTTAGSLWIYLYQVNNPSNLGGVVRTAEAAGAKGLLLSPGSADPFSPKALRSSMGSAFRLPIVEGFAPEKMLSTAKDKGISVTAVHATGENSFTNVDWNKPRLLIFGSEAEGLPDGLISKANESIRIPMHGKVESLNLAVSAGIVLFEAKRQWDSKG